MFEKYGRSVRDDGGGSVRTGSINLIALVIVLCLAVLAVLTVTTTRASTALAKRQAAFTTDGYANEAVAQEILARVRNTAEEGGLDAVEQQLDTLLTEVGDNGPAVSAELDGNSLCVHVESESGRCLDAVLVISGNEVSVTSWKATTLWDEDTGDVLWTGRN